MWAVIVQLLLFKRLHGGHLGVILSAVSSAHGLIVWATEWAEILLLNTSSVLSVQLFLAKLGQSDGEKNLVTVICPA